MALRPDQRTLNTGVGSVVLFTVHTTNEYESDYPPRVTVIETMALDDPERPVTHSFVAGLPGWEQQGHAYRGSVEDQYGECLVSLALQPGVHQLQRIIGKASGFLISGSCQVPIFHEFEVQPDEVVYIGRIIATNRERLDDSDIPAGSRLPLLDQAVSGFGGGTFDVEIIDNFEQDIAAFREVFAVLDDVSIERRVLPSWRRLNEDQIDVLSEGGRLP